MALSLELTINSTVRPVGRYVGWTPAHASLRIADGDEQGPVQVRLGNGSGAGGKLVFRSERKDAPQDRLEIELPDDGSGRDFLVSGRFGSPSVDDGDAPLVVTRTDGTPLDAFPLMVRVRKDANALTDLERNRFLTALAELNDHGTGPFTSFRLSHRQGTLDEAHRADGFLPWHRAYLLDLERTLQVVDPRVALPYWRFDQPAPNLFTREFFGAPDGPVPGFADLAPDNPLITWTVGGRLGIMRTPLFDTATSAAHDDNGQGVRPESVIVDFAGPYGSLRGPFEADPHGAAHTSFAGEIQSPPTAPRDPLFFLLHCNVDRIWARWQAEQARFDGADVRAYRFQGAFGDPGATRIGHNLRDTMWPWNGVTGGPGPRPPTAPRTPFPTMLTFAPSSMPRVGDMIDYQGRFDATDAMTFDYDDVDFAGGTP